MRILTLNCGSSSLKFKLFRVGTERDDPTDPRPEAHGIVDRIGGPSFIDFSFGDEQLRQERDVRDHAEATRLALDWMDSIGIQDPEGIDAVGHRVVHGGERFVEPTLLDEDVFAAIESLRELAPLHNAPAIAAIRETKAVLGDSVPAVAVFDTAFHQTLPHHASHYAIPGVLAEKHGIRRFGFHGLAHRYMSGRYLEITGAPSDRIKLITLQLGSGCSAAAIRDGRSVDTSMGFSPLEGLMMGTRSGDVDPSLVGFIARREGVPAEEVEDWLNTRSGLLGVSSRSQDVRELLDAEREGDQAAHLALEMFSYRVRKCIGAYLAGLGGADALVFGGGIGEQSTEVRARICEDMGWTGLILEPERNDRMVGKEGEISSDRSRIRVYVIPVDEQVLIARDTLACVQS